MAKFWMLFAMILLSTTIATAFARREPFIIRGRVYCDTCRAGFETTATTYIPDAKVRIECKDSDKLNVVYSVDATTDSTGTYEIKVEDDHKDQICYAKLISSPIPDCKTEDPGRNHAHVILTRSNGAISNLHFANSMGFLKDEALDGCSALLKHYFPMDDVEWTKI